MQGQAPLSQIGLINEAVNSIQHKGDMQLMYLLLCVSVKLPRRRCTASRCDTQHVGHRRLDAAHVVEKQSVRVLGGDHQIFVIVRKRLYANDARIDQGLYDPAEEGLAAALIAHQDQDDKFRCRHLRVRQRVADPCDQQKDTYWI